LPSRTTQAAWYIALSLIVTHLIHLQPLLLFALLHHTRPPSLSHLSNPYTKTTGKDCVTNHTPTLSHSKQDLCHAALSFASDTLKPGGNFVCKFYQGAEDKAFEALLKKMFAKVHREKPESSRSVSL
jgi:hypothetical protein